MPFLSHEHRVVKHADHRDILAILATHISWYRTHALSTSHRHTHARTRTRTDTVGSKRTRTSHPINNSETANATKTITTPVTSSMRYERERKKENGYYDRGVELLQHHDKTNTRVTIDLASTQTTSRQQTNAIDDK